jgi:hypothetical protein
VVETEALEEYIQVAPQLGFVRSSTSAASAEFFVTKKDGGLRPCINYIVSKSKGVTLPPSAMEVLREEPYFL